ncbi:hypothetical protein D9M68_684400 [compost metagenome]
MDVSGAAAFKCPFTNQHHRLAGIAGRAGGAGLLCRLRVQRTALVAGGRLEPAVAARGAAGVSGLHRADTVDRLRLFPNCGATAPGPERDRCPSRRALPHRRTPGVSRGCHGASVGRRSTRGAAAPSLCSPDRPDGERQGRWQLVGERLGVGRGPRRLRFIDAHRHRRTPRALCRHRDSIAQHAAQGTGALAPGVVRQPGSGNRAVLCHQPRHAALDHAPPDGATAGSPGTTQCPAARR